MIRDQIVDFLRRELIGPDPVPPNVQENGEEILTSDPPRIRYGAGVLFPRTAVAAIVQDTSPSEAPDAGEAIVFEGEEPQVEIIGEDRAADGSLEEAAMEDSIALANAYLPSAAGFSCLVELPDDGFQLDVSAARYRMSTRIYEVRGEEKKGFQYEREPISASLLIPTGQLQGPGIKSCQIPVELNGANTGLVVNVVSRPRGKSPSGSDLGLLTVTLINANESGDGRAENEKCFFQVAMLLAAASGEACFVEYPEREGESLDDEDRSLRLLYRHRKTFAIGHGCATDWEESSGRATLIRTDFLPTYEVKPVVPARFEDLDLSMLGLSDLRDEANVINLLMRLCDRYEKWIEEREAEAAALDGELGETAERHIANCRTCLLRMREGLKVLGNDTKAMTAFRLANRAMLLQQLHYSIPLREWEAGVGGLTSIPPLNFPDIQSPAPGKGSWYPFQLAFILINLRSQAFPNDGEREVVDLIWFPTGGGKTEAYLGLTAFTIFLRRLRDPRNAGVTVLMRYTLRLLTAQQFQRAATLICACEHIRCEMARQLGGDRISIGLWVGMGLTPNKRADAVQAHTKLTRGEGRENQFVLLRCPWCSAQMGPVEVGNRRYVKGYEKRRNPSTIVFTCPDRACPFSASGALPLYVIDEDIYEETPTLLIGTVDKFAMLPWRPEARSLFAVNREEHAPPDLIIQDELHLISGPLGSMFGHYETAINELCTDRRGGRAIAPKIVASTATICRAAEQVGCLYSRKVFQFPPQCLRASDSFFAREDGSAPGRRYVGVHASALPSHVTVQVRVFSALLQAAKSAVAEEEKDRDPYYTLLAYFNSLRELGHAATLTRADIREYLNAMWLRKEIKGDARRFIYSALELTSRISSSEIPESLQMLERRYPAGEGEKAVDVCLATNMISVGVDVPRLGLMAVIGQPKTTSEYIQATSRVGRDRGAPGLVVTIYHTGKPRDRSHYEHFRPYHASIYRQVEPTSVTPFAAPVRDRALHALVVTLVRYLGNPANTDRPQPFPNAGTIRRIEEVIRRRVYGVDPNEEPLTLELLRDILDQWGRVLPPRYGDFGPPQPELPLMYPAGMYPLEAWESKSFPTPSSMRNVDASCEAGVINQYPEPLEG